MTGPEQRPALTEQQEREASERAERIANLELRIGASLGGQRFLDRVRQAGQR